MNSSDFEAILSEELIKKMTECLSDDETLKESVDYVKGCLDTYLLACKISRQNNYRFIKPYPYISPTVIY